MLVIVGLVGSDLHVRIFDSKGQKVVDKAEKELVSGEALTDLKDQLDPFPDVSGLSQKDKQEIIKNATSTAAHALLARNAEAESYYKQALALNPSDAKTHHYLGLLYEDLQDAKAAQVEYQIAARSCEDTDDCVIAYNNLARLYILENNYSAAMTLLKERLRVRPTDDPKLKYYLHKNLAWVRLEQDRLAEAEAELRGAFRACFKNPKSG